MSSHISRSRPQHGKQSILCLITRAGVRASPSLPSQCEEVTGEIMAVISHSSPGRPPINPDSHITEIFYYKQCCFVTSTLLCLCCDYSWSHKNTAGFFLPLLFSYLTNGISRTDGFVTTRSANKLRGVQVSFIR